MARGFTAIGTGGDDFVQAMVVSVESILEQQIPEEKNEPSFFFFGGGRVVFKNVMQEWLFFAIHSVIPSSLVIIRGFESSLLVQFLEIDSASGCSILGVIAASNLLHQN
ncbi:uncharacterized protein LOC143861857 [Tasmannia lanceolata]|uniref:uncharacterized protein LOC143861857 n=1 Tax=Tasmannia lanceolata TaxID=3420 RepID=UPI004063928C